MEQQVLLDKLSEFLMVEQGGLQLYRVAAARCAMPNIKQRYQEFGEQTARHRQVLVQLIQALGGDPNYVSPTARLAQVKATKLIESSMIVDRLAPEEIMANDLENVLLAETKDHADWHVLSEMAEQADGELRKALVAAVEEVEEQEDEHLEWARETLSELSLQMAAQGPAPSPERWQHQISGPEPAIDAFHPAPFTDGLLEGSREPLWIDSSVSRSLQKDGGPKGR